MGRDGERKDEERGRDEEGWRGHGVVWSEGGRGSRAHSPELVVARVCSWALAVICELWWPFWLVVGRMCHGSWAMAMSARRWVVVPACEQWMVVGDRLRAVGGRRGCRLCPSLGTGH